MKIKYSVLVALLAASVLATPAMAGSTKTKDNGSNRQYTVDQSVDKSTSQVIGTLTITGCWGDSHGYSGGKTVYNSGKVSVDYSNPCSSYVQSLINAAKSTVDSIGSWAVSDGGRGGYYGSTVSSSQSSWDNRNYTWVNDGDQGDVILVGDTDSYGSTFAAQGNADRHMLITGDYGKTTVYRVNGTGYVSPIVLDLDGDGKIEASNGKYLPHSADVSKSNYAVMFDFYGNGFPVVMEWVGTNDGLLCRPHKDGSIDGTCLFGVSNGHDNGYEELASLDINKDGKLEAAELDGLMVWTDKNSNGAAEEGEVATLESLGITSIGVEHNNYVGNYVRNGKSYKTFDWWPCVIDCRKVNVKNI